MNKSEDRRTVLVLEEEMVPVVHVKPMYMGAHCMATPNK